jgi:hypothetical protein
LIVKKNPRLLLSGDFLYVVNQLFVALLLELGLALAQEWVCSVQALVPFLLVQAQE